jgi:hypothetical protein
MDSESRRRRNHEPPPKRKKTGTHNRLSFVPIQGGTPSAQLIAASYRCIAGIAAVSPGAARRTPEVAARPRLPLAGNCGDAACTTFGNNVTGGGGALKLLLWNNGQPWTLRGK